jgi:hypothetical protein
MSRDVLPVINVNVPDVRSDVTNGLKGAIEGDTFTMPGKYRRHSECGYGSLMWGPTFCPFEWGNLPLGFNPGRGCTGEE